MVRVKEYLPRDTSLSTVSTPVPRMFNKACPASEYNKPRTKVSCTTAGVLQQKHVKKEKEIQQNNDLQTPHLRVIARTLLELKTCKTL